MLAHLWDSGTWLNRCLISVYLKKGLLIYLPAWKDKRLTQGPTASDSEGRFLKAILNQLINSCRRRPGGHLTQPNAFIN